MPRSIRILITDDSAFMRRAISRMLEGEADFQIVGTANSGEDALQKARALAPDVITMDVEMPGIGGLEAIRRLAAERPTPIIMVSALTREGAETTLRGLELGASDFIAKPDSAYIDIGKLRLELIEKIRALGRRGTPVPARPRVPAKPFHARRAGGYRCVGIGASTGGPVALGRVLGALPGRFPVPIVIVQHMPVGFTRPLADRLAASCRIRVREAEDGEALRPGIALVAPAGRHLRLKPAGDDCVVALEPDGPQSVHVPSIDLMAASLAEAFGSGTLAVILTGMGQDGVVGCRAIKARGGFVLAQDEATSVVYGMPRAAAAAGLVDRLLPIDEIGPALCELTGAAAPP